MLQSASAGETVDSQEIQAFSGAWRYFADETDCQGTYPKPHLPAKNQNERANAGNSM